MYESKLGKPIHDRTWRNIKQNLQLQEVDTYEQGKILSIYAYLRSKKPNQRITRGVIKKFQILSEAFTSEQSKGLTCTGKEILSVTRRLNPPPADSTIYRWGKELGLGFRVERIYQDDEVFRWVEKIALNPRYDYDIKHLGLEQHEHQSRRTA